MPTSWSQEKFSKAYRFAAKAHLGQTLPASDLPYLVHLGLVTMEVLAALAGEDFQDGDLAIQCALLHDVLEDTPTSFATLAEVFGLRVAQGVQALTKDFHLDKSQRMADSLRRIREQPHEIWLVKLADRITNLAPPHPSWSREKILGYRQEAGMIHQSLARASPFLADRLQQRIMAHAAFA